MRKHPYIKQETLSVKAHHLPSLASAEFDAVDIFTRFEAYLESLLPPPYVKPHRLHQAMRHSILAGGKRLRPQLLLLVAEACTKGPFSQDVAQLSMLASCAVEMIHSASLIHDDLPMFDNAEFRRGKATVHVAYDEQTALLAGDALIALAFEVLSRAPAKLSSRGMRIIQSLATAVSSHSGLTGGQSLELAQKRSEPTEPRPPTRLAVAEHEQNLDLYHDLKTAALFRAAAEAGAYAAGENDVTTWREFGCYIGRAFQLGDDLYDVFSHSQLTAKPVHRDAELGRPNAVFLIGEQEACRQLDRHLDRAAELLSTVTEKPLRLLDWISKLRILFSQTTSYSP